MQRPPWLGKLIGGLIGWLVLGPVGLILGLLLGHVADKTHLVPEVEALGILPERLGAASPRRAAWLADLRRVMGEVDVVHAHSPVLASAARLVARTLPPSHRPAVVTTEHNEWTSHRTPTRLLNGLTAPLDAHHWAVSDQVRDTVWRSRRQGYEVLIHGIDPQAVRPDPAVRARAVSYTHLTLPTSDLV